MLSLSDLLAVVGKVSPANHNNSTVSTDAVDMSKFHQAYFVLLLGASGSIDSTVAFKLEEAAASNFASPSDISGKAITSFGGTDDAKVAVVELLAEECGQRYVRGTATVGNGTTNILAVVALGVHPRFAPASDEDLAAVAQIVR